VGGAGQLPERCGQSAREGDDDHHQDEEADETQRGLGLAQAGDALHQLVLGAEDGERPAFGAERLVEEAAPVSLGFHRLEPLLPHEHLADDRLEARAPVRRELLQHRGAQLGRQQARSGEDAAGAREDDRDAHTPDLHGVDDLHESVEGNVGGRDTPESAGLQTRE